MTDSDYSFYQLPEALTSQLEFDATPFPIRTQRAGDIFASQPVSLDEILSELDQFLVKHPEETVRYENNAFRLTMICATEHMENEDYSATLESLNIGLRINPGDRRLQVHHALVLQISGDDEAAAREYKNYLDGDLDAVEPLIRVMAAKAFAAIDKKETALAILEFMPEGVFADPSLQRLRESLLSPPPSQCTTCGQMLQPEQKFCSECGTPVIAPKTKPEPEQQPRPICTSCGKKLKPGVKFCTSCGALL
jgi:predicted nucleic acid-binding Zn ribbon protein